MSIQLLFCVETRQTAETDKIYIDETIANFYHLGNSVRKRYIFFKGKGNYNKQKVVKRINEQIRQFKDLGPTYVIYCIDTDRYDANPDQARELGKIQNYCEHNRYDLVWFCRDVEDVYWGEQVHNDDKTRMAARFRSGMRIKNISSENLKKEQYSRHMSNILIVLDKYLGK